MAIKANQTKGATSPEPKRRSNFVNIIIRVFKEKYLGAIGLVFVSLLLFVGIFADFLAPYNLGQMDLAHSLEGPSRLHLLGTDNLGRDLLSNIIYGARVSMIIGISATSCAISISVLIGSISAILGSKFDLIVQRFVDAFQCIPTMFILLLMVFILGRGTWQVIVALAVPSGIGGSRVIRSAVLGIKENMYVDAARTLGSPTWRLLLVHIIPNIAPVIIIMFSLGIGNAIMAESGLSFLGFGVPPGVPSWGSMLSLDGRQYMEQSPLIAVFPGLAIAMAVWGFNMFGDALRDLLDPKLRGGLGRYTNISKKLLKKIRAQAELKSGTIHKNIRKGTK